MKKVYIGVGAVFILFVGALVVLMTVDFNRINKDTYYVQVTTDGELEEYKLNTGKIAETYWYELPSYDESGKERTLKFSATKNLRKDAYLKLYVKGGKGVSSYDEVQFDEIPTKAQEKLK
ncbi:YxeA family protein [Lysinibacillus sp. NPDC096418]|uniref:YxeA family protein n=1 Tax=Lysinibacillus sp. NPDC096418 TaxID=3364138 RepID=UPI0037FE8103